MTNQNLKILLAYSEGRLSRRDAIERLGLRDSADLLVALGDAGLMMPMPSEKQIKEEAATFVSLWKMGWQKPDPHAFSHHQILGSEDRQHWLVCRSSTNGTFAWQPALAFQSRRGGCSGRNLVDASQ